MIGYVISKQERNFFKKIFNKLDIEEYEKTWYNYNDGIEQFTNKIEQRRGK